MKKYKLLQTAIVTAISASEQSARGAVWAAEERNEELEGDALVRVGIAEETTEEPSVITAAARKRKDLEAENAEEPQLSGIRFDAIRQSDGTFRSSTGVPVNEDGSPITAGPANPSNADIGSFLDGNAAEVIASIKELPASERGNLGRLLETEKAGKNRTTVIQAIEAAQAE